MSHWTKTTERLVVSAHELPSTHACYERTALLARLNHADTPEVVAHATVWCGMGYLEWIEVNTDMRRRGIGRELIDAVTEYLGTTPRTCGATEAGKALLAAAGIPDETAEDDAA